MPNQLETRCLSSLVKVFADEQLQSAGFYRASAFCNETYSFQVAVRSSVLVKSIKVKVVSGLYDGIVVRRVGLVPSELPCLHDSDSYVLRKTPGLYPDPLYPIHPAEGLPLPPDQWRAVWISVHLDGSYPPGLYPITIHFENNEGQVVAQETFELEVLPVELPKQKLIHTEWLHTDCLAQYYKVEVFSEKHWELIDSFIDTAVKHGINMILTPVFTPPLDTAVGGERLTVQLVEVWKQQQDYRFGFDKLERWIRMCRNRGVEYFEFSHLFTQWGARHAPKILAWEDGEHRKIFGWETDASGGEYLHFLSQFLPALTGFIKQNELENNCFFHNSDEPRTADLEQYRKLSEFTSALLAGFPIIDALSDYQFYEQGAVKLPIPASNHIEPFIENEVQPLWTYYCVSQRNLVSNRFFNMPSARNRIIGMQLFKFSVTGFLHWGYNFWNSQYSTKAVNPFLNTDANYSFPSGDAFLVYPGENGPVESIRMEVFYESLQDLRALKLLEEHLGKEKAIQFLEEDLEQPITFKEYPRTAEWLLNKREALNRKIMEIYKADVNLAY